MLEGNSATFTYFFRNYDTFTNNRVMNDINDFTFIGSSCHIEEQYTTYIYIYTLDLTGPNNYVNLTVGLSCHIIN